MNICLHNILGYVANKVLRNDYTKNIQFMVYQLLWYVMLIKYQSQLTYVKVSDHDSKIYNLKNFFVFF